MRILGIDYGEKYIGVAFADTNSILIAQPFEIVNNNGKELDRLAEIAKLKKIEKVILGYPRNLSGEATQQTEIVKEFGKKIETHLALPLEYQDETLSSVVIQEELSEDTKGRKKRIDDQAAALILQDYLEEEFRK